MNRTIALSGHRHAGYISLLALMIGYMLVKVSLGFYCVVHSHIKRFRKLGDVRHAPCSRGFDIALRFIHGIYAVCQLLFKRFADRTTFFESHEFPRLPTKHQRSLIAHFRVG